MKRRLGIVGGTFDPVHLGHLDLAAAAERALGLTGVLLVPAHVPPHRPPPVASPFHRFAMVSLAVAGNRGWRASDMELLDPARSYTSATLQRLHEQGWDASELYFVIGVDAFRDIATWKNYPAILDDANFAVVSRPGHALDQLRRELPALAPRMVAPDSARAGPTAIILIEAKTADVSATAIRRALAEHRDVSALVPAGVAEHIARHGLYSSPAPDRRNGDLHFHPAAGRLHGQD
jgi:nicotinate-nucleotide adenylyltransferase